MRPFWHAMTIAVGAILVALPVGGLRAQADDPLIGMWRLNLEQSEFSPGAPPERLTRTFEAQEDGMILATTAGLDAAGHPVEVRVSFRRDGEAYPIESEGTTTERTIAFEVLSRDPFTVEYRTMGGAGSTVGTETISPDGNTYTVMIVGTNRDGARVNTVQVWDRQQP